VYGYTGGVLSDCTISGNHAVKFGGGVFSIGVISLTNCLICNMNSAAFGGGVYFWEGGELYNCTIATNYAYLSGGGIVCSNGGSVINTIIYDNQAALEKNNWQSYASNVTFSYCCTIPTNNLSGGNGCISDDPMFVAPGLDYHLLEGSPCIDGGTNLPWMIGATDLDGNPRIYDDTVDMGCYEFIPEPGAFGAVISYLLLVIGIWRKFIPRC